jgi:YbbR domain-containing protein
MKNPLDSLWGTVISGLILTAVLFVIVSKMMH